MDNYQKAHNECSGKVQHHWSYLPENHLDIILLTPKLHSWLHSKMRLDKGLLCYWTKEGELLDTREKHLAFIKKLKEVAGDIYFSKKANDFVSEKYSPDTIEAQYRRNLAFLSEYRRIYESVSK